MEVVPFHNVSYKIEGLQQPGSIISIESHNDSNLFDDKTQHVHKEKDHFDFILYSVVVPLVFGIITFTGIVGNILVIHVIRSRRKMRTVTNLLLLNLAVADLSFVMICPPFTAYQMATSSWPFPGLFGDIICKLMHYLLNVTVYVTIYTLVVISVIRWLTIVHNTATMALRTMKNTTIIIISIWVIMLGVNVPIILSYGVQELPELPDNMNCENFGFDVGQKLYTTFFAFAYMLPLIIIAGFSMSILNHIRVQQPTMLNKKRSKSDQRKKQATRLIILVIVIFAIFWLPVHIHLLVAYYGSMPTSRFYQCIAVFWNCLAYFNSCVNPIIYNYASKEFRDCFRETVLCVKHTPDWDREISVVTRVINGNHDKKMKEAVVIANGAANNIDEGGNSDKNGAEEV